MFKYDILAQLLLADVYILQDLSAHLDSLKGIEAERKEICQSIDAFSLGHELDESFAYKEFQFGQRLTLKLSVRDRGVVVCRVDLVSKLFVECLPYHAAFIGPRKGAIVRQYVNHLPRYSSVSFGGPIRCIYDWPDLVDNLGLSHVMHGRAWNYEDTKTRSARSKNHGLRDSSMGSDGTFHHDWVELLPVHQGDRVVEPCNVLPRLFDCRMGFKQIFSRIAAVWLVGCDLCGPTWENGTLEKICATRYPLQERRKLW